MSISSEKSSHSGLKVLKNFTEYLKMKKIVVITSNQIRHDYFRTMFSAGEGIEVLKSYESTENQIMTKRF